MLLFFILYTHFTNGRWDHVATIEINGGGTQGMWQSVQNCPDSTWARGFRHKYDENYAADHDQIGTVLVEIYCFDSKGIKLSTLATNSDIVEYQSTWSPYLECPDINNFLKGINQKVGTQGYGVTNVCMECVDGTKLEPENTLSPGDYQGYSDCPTQSAICGIQSKFQPFQGAIDDSGLNDLRIFCCSTCDQDSGRYFDKLNLECKYCHYSCKTCTGALSSDCLSCYHSESPVSNVCPLNINLLEIESNIHTPSGWTGYPSSTISDCGSFYTGFLGGYNVFGVGAYAQKTYTTLPPHFKKRIRLRFLKIDSWNNEYAYLYIDKTQIISKMFKLTDGLLTGSHCGNKDLEYDYFLEAELLNNLQSFTIKISTNLDSTADNKSWGFSNFYLGIMKCDSTCASCSDENPNSCVSCYPNASPTAGVCSCNDNYFMVIITNCVTSPCSSCTPCYIGCRKCTGPNISDCQSCIPDYYFYLGKCNYRNCPDPMCGNNATLMCEASCTGTSIYLDPADRICKACDPTCLTCTEKLNTNCRTCDALSFFSIENPSTEGKCLKSCMSPRFAHFPTKTCLEICPMPLWGRTSDRVCSGDCQTISEYKDSGDRICKACHSSCYTCEGPLASDCLSCETNLYFYGGSCLNNCGVGKYGNQSTHRCENCNPNCRTCKTPDQPDSCLTCPVNWYLKNANACFFKSCSENEYIDFTDNNCKRCDSTCLTCFGGTPKSCLSCLGTFYFYEPDSSCLSLCPFPYYSSVYDHICYKTCPLNNYGRSISRSCEATCLKPNEFADPSDRICKACHMECKTCFGITNLDCLSCDLPRSLKKKQCVLDCGPGSYSDNNVSPICKLCSAECKTCIDSSDKCLECATDSKGIKFYLKDNNCVSECGGGYFLWFDNVCRPCASDKCIICHESCKTCNGESVNNCLSCWDSYFLRDGQCVTVCGAGLFKSTLDGKQVCSSCLNQDEYADSNEGLCKKCPLNCTFCDQKGCIKCRNNYFAMEWECSAPSTYSCQLCEARIPYCIQCGETALGCFRCKSGYFLLDKEGDNANEECTKCVHSTLVKIKSNCFSCGRVLDGCSDCYNDPENCNNCKEGYFLSVNNLKRTCKICAPDCPCEEKKAGCLKCVYKNMNLLCIQCQPGFYFVDYNGDSVIDYCSKCQEAYQYISLDNSQCIDCNKTNKGCLNCNGNPNNCTECLQGYYRIKLGENSLCSTCKNENETINIAEGLCYSCQEEVVGCERCEFKNNRIDCLSCGKGFVKINSSCMANCFTQGKKIDLNKKTCVENCDEGYFEFLDSSVSQIVCKKCSNQCYSCKDDEESCLSCSSYLFNKTCVDKCPDPYRENKWQKSCSRCATDQFEVFQNNIFLLCSFCEKPCTSCFGEKNNCTSCDKGLFLSLNICYQYCPPGTYPDSASGICMKCHPICKECTGTSNQSCTSCNNPLFLHSKQCLENCPPGLYPNEQIQECILCHYSCKFCIGPKEYHCLEKCYERRHFLPLDSGLINITKANISAGICQCNDGFYENKAPECGGCHLSCEKCIGPLHTDCTACAANRGDKDKRPVEGFCNCPPSTFDYLIPTCLGPDNQTTAISLVEAFQQDEISQIGFLSTAGVGSINVFGFLFNIVEVAQEINLYSFLNINKPLNLETLFDFLTNFRFYRYLNIFSKLKIPIRNNSAKTKSNTVDEQEPPPLFSKRGLTSSFLSNASSILLLVILCPLLLYLMTCISSLIANRRNKKKNDNKPEIRKTSKELKLVRKSTIHQLMEKFWKKKNVILFNTLFSLFLGSLQELQFFFALQMMNISFSNTYNVISFTVSIVWVIYELVLISFMVRVYFSMNPMVLDKFNLKKKITIYITKRKLKDFEVNDNSIHPTKIALNTSTCDYNEEQKEKYSFFFGNVLKQDSKGMSFFFFRIIKKVILPMIHVFFHIDIHNAISFLICLYVLCFLYLRLVEPYRYKVIAILAESTELLHINFLIFVKFYVYAVHLKNSEIALTLGLYMIFSILAIIFVNALSLITSISILLYSWISEIWRKNKSLKRPSKKLLTSPIKENSKTMPLIIKTVDSNKRVEGILSQECKISSKSSKENADLDDPPENKNINFFQKTLIEQAPTQNVPLKASSLKELSSGSMSEESKDLPNEKDESWSDTDFNQVSNSKILMKFPISSKILPFKSQKSQQKQFFSEPNQIFHDTYYGSFEIDNIELFGNHLIKDESYEYNVKSGFTRGEEYSKNYDDKNSARDKKSKKRKKKEE